MTSVPGESRYGFQVSGVPGTTWINDVSKRVDLVITGG
jgi:hypothetical protein